MAQFFRRPGRGRLGIILCGLVLATLVAVPVVAQAAVEDDANPPERQLPERHHLPEAFLHPARGVASCEAVAEGERPRMTRFIDELMADGVISEEQAAEIRSRLAKAREDACLESMLWHPGDGLQAIAEVTGTTHREVLGALIAGQTAAEYAAEHGVGEDALIAALMAEPEARAAELIEAGELDAQRAEELLDAIEARIAEAIHSDNFGFHGIRGPGAVIGELDERMPLPVF